MTDPVVGAEFPGSSELTQLLVVSDVSRAISFYRDVVGADLVREYGGAHSGEHGDGIVRSEFHEEMFGARR